MTKYGLRSFVECCFYRLKKSPVSQKNIFLVLKKANSFPIFLHIFLSCFLSSSFHAPFFQFEISEFSVCRMNRSSPYFCGTCSVDHQAKCHVLTCRHASALASSYSHGVWPTLLLETFGKMNWRCCWPIWRSNGNSMRSKMRELHTG